jgi:hypothetical protein
MDETVWAKYVKMCLAPEIHGPSVLILDDFEAHASDVGQAIVAEEACCSLAPVPPAPRRFVSLLMLALWGH